MSNIRFLSQGDLDFSCGPLHSAHPTGDISLLLLLPPKYLLGGGSSLLDSPTPLLPSSLLPPPFLSSPLLLLTPQSAATWHCARPSTQPKCAGLWTVPVVLPPNRPTSLPPAPTPSPKASSPVAMWPPPSLPYGVLPSSPQPRLRSHAFLTLKSESFCMSLSFLPPFSPVTQCVLQASGPLPCDG